MIISVYDPPVHWEGLPGLVASLIMYTRTYPVIPELSTVVHTKVTELPLMTDPEIGETNDGIFTPPVDMVKLNSVDHEPSLKVPSGYLM